MKTIRSRIGKTFTAFFILMMAMALISCGKSSQSTASSAAKTEEAYQSGDAVSGNTAVSENRKLTKDVTISAETEDFTAADEAIRKAAEDAGGYVEYSDLTNYGNARSESIAVRVPADKLDAYLQTVENACSVMSKSEQTEDITDAYNETESELKSLNAELDSLNAMLGKAETVEDTISIQDRISDVRSRIESLEDEKQSYDSQIAYSTVSISLNEAQVAIGSTKTVGERISYGFRNTLHAIGTFFVELFIFLVSASPALAIVAAVTVLIVFLVRRSIRRAQEKRNAQAAAWNAQMQGQAQGQMPGQTPGQMQGQAPGQMPYMPGEGSRNFPPSGK